MKYKLTELGPDCLVMEVDGKRVSSVNPEYSCRQVFIFNDFVVKLDCGSDQNLAEVEFYDQLEECDKPYFPRLLDWNIPLNAESPNYVVMERVFPQDSKKPTEKQLEIAAYLKNKYELEDMFLIGMPSCYGQNAHWNHNVTPVGDDSIMIYDVGVWAGVEF